MITHNLTVKFTASKSKVATNLLVDRFIDVRFLIFIIVHDSAFVYSVAVSGHCFFL